MYKQLSCVQEIHCDIRRDMTMHINTLQQCLLAGLNMIQRSTRA